MKDWQSNHPKAKLMGQKRAAIITAARSTFLRLGYEGASMEAIAAGAGVSIMTLYRHAESKDELFSAVIARACDPDDEAERAEYERLLRKPLREVLILTGMAFQERLADAETVSLMRLVMGETTRFPDLARRAYQGFVGHLEEIVQAILAEKGESLHLDPQTRRELSATFIDGLFGADMLRVLLGLGGASSAQRKERAERASDKIMAAATRIPEQTIP